MPDKPKSGEIELRPTSLVGGTSFVLEQAATSEANEKQLAHKFCAWQTAIPHLER